MAAMPRPRPPHLVCETTRHGKRVWYVRVGHGPRIRIAAEFGTEAFTEAYNAALDGETTPRRRTATAGTLAWLLERYRESAPWLALSPATRRQRDNIFVRVLDTAGAYPFARITRKAIVDGRERRAKTPSQARNYLDAVRGLFRWATDAKLIANDPTAGVKNPARPKGDGFVPWTEEDVERYRERWPIGTRQRLWMELILATGLRRGDAVIFGRQHIRSHQLPDGRTIKLGIVKTEKSGKTVPAIFPITSELEAILDRGPCGDLTFICTERGQPFGSKESFGNEFSTACKDAKVPGSAHGLRKLAAIRAVHSGATTAQMRALFAWVDDAMPSLYTKGADRHRLAIEGALLLLANKENYGSRSTK